MKAGPYWNAINVYDLDLTFEKSYRVRSFCGFKSLKDEFWKIARCRDGELVFDSRGAHGGGGFNVKTFGNKVDWEW